MRLPFGCAFVSAALAFALGSGCLASKGHGSGAAEPTKAPRQPAPSASDAVAEPKLVKSPSPRAEDSSAAAFDFSAAGFVLDDPTWSDARAPYAAGDYAGAASKLEALLSASSPDKAARARYQLGRLRQRAGDTVGAAKAFDAAAEDPSWPLVPYARFAAAQAYVRAGLLADGIARAQAVPEGLPISGQAHLLVGEALEAKHDSTGALEIYDAYLADGRRPPRWTEIALRAAEVLLSRARPEHAERAARLARRVLLEAPAGSLLDRAIALERRAYLAIGEARHLRPLLAHGPKGKMLVADWANAFSPKDQLVRATALADASSYRDAASALELLLSRVRGRSSEVEVTCRGELESALVLGKLREPGKASAAFERAIESCASHPDALVEALYQGGKASAAGGRCDEAMSRFGRVERDFPDHRYADDARLRGAECALSLGDSRRYEEMLERIGDDYPNSDMAAEGLFRLAIRRASLGQWSQALAVLVRGEPLDVRESPRGRFAYFKARALAENGDLEAAARAYEDVLRRYPLSYYALHAYSRLSELDPKAAEEAVDATLAVEPEGRFAVADAEHLHDGGFARGLELLGQGELDWARKELGGFAKDDANPESLWAVVVSYARAGLVRDSHWLAKTRLTDWLSHYPEGRWREAWELAYPRPFARLVEREAEKSGIPQALAYAIMREESAFDADAVSPARAYGLMQLIVPTAKHVAKELGVAWTPGALAEPETNVKLGCQFLGDLRAKFPTNPHLAISAYNAGPGAPLRWISTRASDAFDLWVEQIPYEETRRYTKRVLTSYAAYSYLYGRDTALASLKLPIRVIAN